MLALAAVLLFAQRPEIAGVQLASACGYPFWVHAPVDEQAAATAVRDALDEAWFVEMVVDGWPAPLPDARGPDDAFDVYVDPTLRVGESYVAGEEQLPGTVQMRSYMAVPARYDNERQLQSYIAHELAHASQFAMNCDVDDAFFEHTAVWEEARVAGDVDTWSIGVPEFQAHPERALSYLGKEGEYEYGAALWLMFLTREPADVQRLWQQGTDWFAALDGLLAERGLDRAAFFGRFAAWRYFNWLAPVPVTRWTLGDPVEAYLGAYGSAYWQLEAPPPELYAAAGSLAALSLIALDSDGRLLDVQHVGPRSSGHWQRPQQTANVVFALTRTPADYTAPSKDFRKRRTRAAIATNPSTIGTLVSGLGDGDELEGELPLTTNEVGPLPQSCAGMRHGGWVVAALCLRIATRLRRNRASR